MKAAPPRGVEREARRIDALRKELNAYVEALHKRRSTGDTMFQATSRLIGLRDVPCVELHWPSLDALDADTLVTLRDLVDRLATAEAALGEAVGPAWELYVEPTGRQHGSRRCSAP
jgi:hypothetical protein